MKGFKTGDKVVITGRGIQIIAAIYGSSFLIDSYYMVTNVDQTNINWGDGVAVFIKNSDGLKARCKPKYLQHFDFLDVI